jgi:hypothetical protein
MACGFRAHAHCRKDTIARREAGNDDTAAVITQGGQVAMLLLLLPKSKGQIFLRRVSHLSLQAERLARTDEPEPDHNP